MDEAALIEYIESHFEGIARITATDNHFFYYHADPNEPYDNRFPFVTLMVNDTNDDFSHLSRDGICRLNIGLSKESYEKRFGPATKETPKIDFKEIDRIFPHPVYSAQRWVSVLNPGERSWAETKELLEEAYAREKEKSHAKK